MTVKKLELGLEEITRARTAGIVAALSCLIVLYGTYKKIDWQKYMGMVASMISVGTFIWSLIKPLFK